ncbi:MAG: PKD domain-containing protein [Bacteroidetes bacterium]|nr:PKD domain-containing protein [Bacteroidota bacterium]
MKKTFLFLALAFVTTMLFSQNWMNNLPQSKTKSELTLFDYQKAFNDYWAPYNVDAGTYLENGVKKKAVGWKQFKRWEYDMEGRVNPTTGAFPTRTAQEIYEEYLKLNPGMNPASSANWTSLGTSSSAGGYAGIGRLNCVAFHPSNTNTYWVGAAAGGLWTTTNNGTTWTCLTDNNGVLAVSDIFIPTDYASSNTIYIATGDKDHWDNRSIGVLKSTNGGSTWSSTGLSYTIQAGAMVYRLLGDPNNNQVILAATSGGVYKTTNGGTTWNTQLTSTSFIDMEAKPGDFNTLYASTTSGRIYISTNGGTSWAQAFYDAAAYRIELGVSPNQPTWVYAIAANSASGLYGIYKSTNSGASYSQVFAGTTLNLLGWNSDGLDAGGQGWYDLCLAVSPSNASTLLVGGVNTWRSTTGGTSWSIVNHWWGDGVPAVHADKHDLSFRSNGDLFETNDGGVYISTNNGTGWTDKTNGIVVSQMYKLGVSVTVSTETITGLQDNGTKLLSGGVWEDVKGGDGMECLIDFTDVNIQYGTYVNGQIDRTMNHWTSATAIEPSGAGSGAWVTPYIIDPTNAQVLYAGYSDVWKTTNRGNGWTKISTMNTSNKIRSMAIAPSNNQYIYVADPSVIWKTTNGGTSWSVITGTLPVGSGSITYIAVKNDDPLTLWVTLGGYNTTTCYQSIDGGSNWTNISTGLPQLPAYAVVQNKQSASEVQLYVGTELGVYFKKGTDNWIPYNTGLPNVKIGELEIYYAANPQNSILRAATFGRGLWQTPVFINCTAPVPTITGASSVCAGTTGITYTTETGMTGYTWSVSSGGTITAGSGTSQITVTWTLAGAQTVSVNYTNSGGCSAPTPTVYNVTVSPQPIADFSFPANNCDGQNVQFMDNSQTNGGGSLNGWNWNFGDPASGTNNTSILENPSHTFSASGIFNVQLIVASSSGCSDTIIHAVTIHSLPAATITPGGPTTFCTGNSVTLTSSPGASYLWSNSETTQSITVSVSGSYTVTVTDGFGCFATSFPTVVTVIQMPAIPATPSGPDTVDLYYVSHSDYLTTPAANADSYTWDITPAGAGSISGSGLTGTVTWTPSYLGSAHIKVKSSNTCGISLWSGEKLTVTINTVTGVPKNISGLSVIIYPNPATNNFTVEFPDYSFGMKSSLDIFDVQGEVVKKVPVTERKTVVDISALPAAVYMIRVTIGNEFRMIKLVKTE